MMPTRAQDIPTKYAMPLCYLGLLATLMRKDFILNYVIDLYLLISLPIDRKFLMHTLNFFFQE